MEHFIDTLGFRSLDKVYRAVNELFPDVKKSKVKSYLDSLGTGYKNAKDMKRKMGNHTQGIGADCCIYIGDLKAPFEIPVNLTKIPAMEANILITVKLAKVPAMETF